MFDHFVKLPLKWLRLPEQFSISKDLFCSNEATDKFVQEEFTKNVLKNSGLANAVNLPRSEADLGLLQHPRWNALCTKCSILDAAAVLDPPLNMECYSVPHL